MIDWKYGFSQFLWWVILLASEVLLVNYNDGMASILWLVIVAVIFFVGWYIFERKFPYFKEKNRETTIKNFRPLWATCVALGFIGYMLLVPDDLKSNMIYNAIFVFFLGLGVIIPSFFTRLKKNAK